MAKEKTTEPILIKDALLITPKTFSEKIIVQERTSILIEDGKISRISGPRDPPIRSRKKHGTIIEADGAVVLPGIFNSHTHSYEMLYKGSWDCHTLHDRLPFDRENMLHRTKDNHTCTISSQASYADMLKNGTTFIGDIFCGNDLDLKRFAEKMKQYGLKGVLYTYDIDHYLSLESDPDSGIFFGLSLPQEEDAAATITQFRLAKDALNEKPGHLHMHVQETAKRARLAKTKFGHTSVEFLKREGLLGCRTLLSHGVHVGKRDIRTMKQTGTGLVSCPTAEMKLCDGVAPIPDYLVTGVPVCLGTDGPICNNSNDMIREAKTFCLLHSITSNNPAIIRPETVLRMLTIDAARCFGMEERLGSIEVGKDADIVLLEGNNFRMRPQITAPYDNRVSNIIYCATGQDVRDVITAGRLIVQNKVLLSTDEDRIRNQLQTHAEKLLSDFESRFYPDKAGKPR